MASRSAVEKGAIVYEYLNTAKELYPLLALGAVELPALPVTAEARKDDASTTSGGTPEVQAQAQQAPPTVGQT